MCRSFIAFFVSILFINISFAADAPAEGEPYNPSADIMHHIADANEFHVFGDISIPLPVILYNQESGDFDMFMSSKFEHGAKEVNGYVLDHGQVVSASGHKFIDFSITKNVFTMLFASILMFILFVSIAKAYREREGKAPKGVQSFFEPLILFVRDEIAVPNLGHRADRFLPYLLTVFFFIWIVNMMGLIPIFPGSANVTGNIAVTLVLAFFTMLITNLSGNKYYWKHIFAPEVPFWLWPIMVIVEMIGVIAKPFALMIRLFANITAGHIIILSLVSLIFVFGELGKNMGGAALGAGIAIPFVLFMNLIELLVAFLQAFIFTILSAVFIGLAVEEAH
ncbi:MAG: F0F1 ATP synthase subunit A [Chitinophagales bacterium]|nr:F0F1 ATP synthase subunit A [Chitinophagales bacterium]